MARRCAGDVTLGLLVCSILVVLCQVVGVQAAGLGLEGGLVTLDFGRLIPGQPVIWPGVSQFRVFADTPWHVSLRAEGDLSDAEGRIIPAERLSWALKDEAGAWGNWYPVRLQECLVAADQLPTGSEGRQLVLGYRFLGSWDDPVGGPFSTTLQLSLVAGIDLVPAYVWPQPFVVGDTPLSVTYWAGAEGSSSSFPTHLSIRDAQGDLIAEVASRATAGTWSSVEWSGHTIEGRPVSAGSYSFAIANEDGVVLAQGVFQVADPAPSGLRGEVGGEVWAEGRPLPGATVDLLTGSGRLVDSAITDGNGSFLFEDLDSGNYSLQVSCPGYLVWSSKRFFLDEERSSHWERVVLQSNNALFIVASVQTVNSSLASASSHDSTLKSGDVVRVSGHVYNSGTRPVRDIVVEVRWPDALQPLSDHNGRGSQLRIPELAPGQSASVSFVAVCGFASDIDHPSDFIVLTARAWAERKSGVFEKVESPPRFLPVTMSRDDHSSGGLLALFVFWDSDEDGRFSSQEAPAVGVRLRIGSEPAVTTDKDGWVFRRVTPGSVGVYHLRDGCERPVLATTIHAGEVLVFYLAFNCDGSLRAIDDVRAAQAAISWNIWSGKLSWQGAGDISAAGKDWSWRWSLPAQVEVVRHGDQGVSEHRLVVDASGSQPSLSWSHDLYGRPVNEGRRDTISLSAIVGRQTAVRYKEWPAAGTGPYDIGVPVQAIHEVSVRSGTRRVRLSEAEYSWSPSGQIWLVRPAQFLVDHGLEAPLLIAAEYIPLDAPGVPTVGIAVRARPRSEGPGAEVMEEFGINWWLPDLTAERRRPIWRVTWERKLPDSRFYWEGGTIESPGENPAKSFIGLMDSPRRGAVSTETSAMWPPYARVEQRLQKGAWWMSVVHERRDLLRKQGLTVGRRFSGFATADLGLRLTRWAGPDAPDGGQASLVVELGQHKGAWQWRLRHSLTLFQIGSAPTEHEDLPQHYDSENASLAVIYAPSSRSGPQVGLHMDTRQGKAWAEFDYAMSLSTVAEAGLGGTAHRGGVVPRARLKWGLVDVGVRALTSESGYRIDVAGEGNGWSAAWRGVYSSARRARELRLHHTKILAHRSLFHVTIRNKTEQPEDILLWETDLVWNGEAMLLGVPWQVGGQLRYTCSVLGQEALRSDYVVVGGSLRRPLNEKTSIAFGGTWPWLICDDWVRRNQTCWVAMERRMMSLGSQDLWGGLELRWHAGRLSPVIHFAFRP